MNRAGFLRKLGVGAAAPAALAVAAVLPEKAEAKSFRVGPDGTIYVSANNGLVSFHQCSVNNSSIRAEQASLAMCHVNAGHTGIHVEPIQSAKL